METISIRGALVIGTFLTRAPYCLLDLKALNHNIGDNMIDNNKNNQNESNLPASAGEYKGNHPSPYSAPNMNQDHLNHHMQAEAANTGQGGQEGEFNQSLQGGDGQAGNSWSVAQDDLNMQSYAGEYKGNHASPYSAQNMNRTNLDSNMKGESSPEQAPYQPDGTNMGGQNQTYPQAGQGMAYAGGLSGQESYATYNQLPQKKGKIGLWIGLGIVLLLMIVLAGFIFGKSFFASQTKLGKLSAALLESQKMKQVEFYQEMVIDNIDIDEFYERGGIQAVDLLKSLSVIVKGKADMDADKMQASMEFNIKDSRAISFFIKQNAQDYILDVPELASQAVYFSEQSLQEFLRENYMGNPKEKLDAIGNKEFQKAQVYLGPAFNPVSLKSFKTLEKKKYAKRLLEHLNEAITQESGSRSQMVDGREVEIKGDVYELTQTGADLEFYYELLTELIKDDNFKPFVTDYLDRIISVAEANQDVYLYNYLMLSSSLDNPVKTEWDEEVKAELIYWKEYTLDAIDQLKDELDRPSTVKRNAEILDQIKDSGFKVISTYVVADKIVKYNNISLEIHPEAMAQSVEDIELDPLDMAGSGIKEMKLHVTSLVLATGSDVQFEELAIADAFDYGNASEEDLSAFYDEVQGNLIQLIFSLDLF